MAAIQAKGLIAITEKHTYRILCEKIKSWIPFLLCLGLIVSVMTGIFSVLRVNGHSMDPTLADGKRYLMVRTQWNPWISVRVGDVVAAEWEDGGIIKRVIAGPGDTLEIQDGTVYRNGSALLEPYINEPMEDQDIGPITLGEGQYYLMGDNRNHSSDSRRFGVFSQQAIMGVVYLEEQPLLWAVCGLLAGLFCAMACCLAPSDKEDDVHE